MIGGTYTALLSQARASFGLLALASAVWVAAIAGASLKLFLPGRFDGIAVTSLSRARVVGGVRREAARRRAADGHPRARPRGRRSDLIGVAFFLWESLKFQTAIWHAFVAVAAAIQFAGVLTAIGR